MSCFSQLLEEQFKIDRSRVYPLWGVFLRLDSNRRR